MARLELKTQNNIIFKTYIGIMSVLPLRQCVETVDGFKSNSIQRKHKPHYAIEISLQL